MSFALASRLFSCADSFMCYSGVHRPLPPRPSTRADVISPTFDLLVRDWVKGVLRHNLHFFNTGLHLRPRLSS